MTQAEAGRALGKSGQAAHKAAKRYGFKFATKDRPKTLAGKSAGSTKHYANVQTNRLAAIPAGSAGRKLYEKLKRHGYSSDEAYTLVMAEINKGKI